LLHLLTTGFGTKRPIWDVRSSAAIEGKADLASADMPKSTRLTHSGQSAAYLAVMHNTALAQRYAKVPSFA
jgi:hypothetical protein